MKNAIRNLKNVRGKLLRCGYTTGSCAAGAAKAAALALLSGAPVDAVCVISPTGQSIPMEVEPLDNGVFYGVRKDSGDDADVTDGMLICARVKKRDEGLCIDGGEGIGRVTKPGLDQPVGAAAINSVPRRMIAEAVREVCAQFAYDGGLEIIIFAPEGEAIAKRTYNARLGIIGGISILGSTGIVEPLSTKALSDSIRLEVAQMAAAGARDLLITPGNYGETFARDVLALSLRDHVRAADFMGATLDAAAENFFSNILIVSHIGKLVKIGIGAFNTHYSYGDGRMETLIACALEAGADNDVLRRVLECVMTDAALDILKEAGVLDGTMKNLQKRIASYLSHRVPSTINLGFICFTNEDNRILTKSENAEELTRIWRS
jgi:cobalt-precorrin-5B (C1)-methyltransferase